MILAGYDSRASCYTVCCSLSRCRSIAMHRTTTSTRSCGTSPKIQTTSFSTFTSRLHADCSVYFMPHSLLSLTAGITIEVSHGYRVKSRDDAYVKKANVFGENFADATLLNGHVVDWLPFRKCSMNKDALESA